MTLQKTLEEIRAFALGAAPGEELTRFLLYHGCGDFLPDRLPDPNRALNRIAVQERYKVCKRLFDRIDFPYAVIKGAVLSERIHGDPFRRQSGDVDMLIRRQDADGLKAILHAEGFLQGRVTEDGLKPFTRQEILFQTAMSHQTAPYIKPTGNPLCPYVNIDVNLDILWGECEERGDMNYVLSHTENVRLFGANFRRLTPEMEFAALCLHHYKDMNSLYLLSKRGLRLKTFFDLYLYLKNVRPAPDKLGSIAERLNIGQYLCVCVEHVHEIFRDEICFEYRQAFLPFYNKALSNTLGLNANERKPWGLSLSDRLFHPDVSAYVLSLCSDAEKKKIEMNALLM